MDFKVVSEKNENWIANKLSHNPDYFNTLSQGQSPEILYIGCSDSRVNAEDVLGAEPGEIFVHRNIANMVINIDLNVQSVIDYAVQHLKVKHIVVCGHYFCGGVKAAMQSANLGLLNPWLRNIRDVYRLHKKELNSIADEDAKYNRLIELNVQEQCINLMKVASVQKAFREENIQVHGWVFDIKTGKLIDLNVDVKEILEGIMEIYRLQ